ncbi:MAG: nodulation protein NfeD [bacterium]|nr:nodulation protein NfeD [bacterium]
MKVYCFLIIYFFIAISIHAQPIVVFEYQGTIGPVAELQLKRSIDYAKEKDALLLIYCLDTPGGLLSTTRSMVQTILNSSIPIVVYISPSGAHAGSAGVFLTLAAHYSAMAPGTNLGSAHPVQLTGTATDSIQGPMKDKVLNDAIAQIKTIAKLRNRNVDWAVKAVTESISSTEVEAESLNVVDTIATNVRDLVNKLNGKRFLLKDSTELSVTISVPKFYYRKSSFTDKLLQFLSDPNIAYILIALGFYGLLFELQNPGALWPGIIGAICLILAFLSFQVLPVNLAGVILLVSAFILFALEVKIVSKGAFTFGGIVALVLGSLLLFELPEDMPGIKWSVIAGVLVTTVLFFVFVVSMAAKALKSRVVTGLEGLIGEEGIALSDFENTGQVFIHGEIWNAIAKQSVHKDEKVRVISVKDNNCLIIDKAE